MNKTKVKVSRDLQEYCQAIAELANEARDEKLWITEAAEEDLEPIPMRRDILALQKVGLLTPPWIDMLWPDIDVRDGETNGLILIDTADVFGIMNIYVTLRDEAGSLLESGCAMRSGVCGHWGYITDVNLPVGMPVFVRAVALDCLGGIRIAYETCTVQAAGVRSKK